ncbi:hypothetical protein EG327_009543 [Venturia inaequalis]|uniref:Isopenicillin N synthase-like Fe(2+) 2OG dioxygenase domain-containing protein n=1 Tax=Venturia inaequalis TaxID=5025 RepID=A0A8H3VL68_VENIN|nr:hypothetical protein EG327_009543 [Venturia inaequalis]
MSSSTNQPSDDPPIDPPTSPTEEPISDDDYDSIASPSTGTWGSFRARSESPEDELGYEADEDEIVARGGYTYRLAAGGLCLNMSLTKRLEGGMPPARNDSARGQAVIECLPYELWRPQIYGLHNQGWTILDFLGAHSYPTPLEFPYPTLLDAVQYGHLNGPLSNSSKLPTNGYMAITKLFKDSKTFFALESDYKMSYNKGDSEAGYTKINGEKEFLTIRDPSSELSTPAEVRASAAEAWKQMYELMYETLAGLEISLKLQPGSLQRYCENARSLGHADGSSMIRIFRYENDTEFKVLAEAHRDLGILSLVIGDKPGLEALDKTSNQFIPIETIFKPGMCTIMAGRQLEDFSNHIFEAAAHRVVSYGPKQPKLGTTPSKTKEFLKPLLGRFNRFQKPKYRYSIVFILRADKSVKLDYEALSSPVTGDVTSKVDGPRTAGELFEKIRKAHFNVNTQVQDRERQKEQLKAVPKLDKAEEEEFEPPPYPPPTKLTWSKGDAESGRVIA